MSIDKTDKLLILRTILLVGLAWVVMSSGHSKLVGGPVAHASNAQAIPTSDDQDIAGQCLYRLDLQAIPARIENRKHYLISDNPEQNYREDFIAYWEGRNQIPESVPELEEYATHENYDRLHFGNVIDVYINRINTEQNINAGMGWGSSYQTHSLNDMYRATGDVKYLEANLRFARASLANRDDKLGYETFFGESAPAWGTAYYAGRHVIHPVHTGMIAVGIVDFLELVQHEVALLAELGNEFDSMVAEITETIDWHNRQWENGPLADEGHYVYRDNEPGLDGQPLAANRLSAMGMALWGSWKASGNPNHRDQAIKLARYMKRRMGLYVEEGSDESTYFWSYNLPVDPIDNPRPWSEVASLNGGEDFSHAALTVCFPLTMGLEGQVFTSEDMEAFSRTVLKGFGRLGEGVLYGNVVGTPVFGPSQVQVVGNWFRIASHSEEAYNTIAEFLLRYQKNPRNVDIAQLIRFLPQQATAGFSGWESY